MSQDGHAAVLDAISAALAAGDTPRLLQALHPGLARRVEAFLPSGSIDSELQRLRTAFPDLRLEAEVLMTFGFRFLARWRAEATHLAEYERVWPSRSQVAIDGVVFVEVAGGQVSDVDIHISASSMVRLFRLYFPGESV